MSCLLHILPWLPSLPNKSYSRSGDNPMGSIPKQKKVSERERAIGENKKQNNEARLMPAA